MILPTQSIALMPPNSLKCFRPLFIAAGKADPVQSYVVFNPAYENQHPNAIALLMLAEVDIVQKLKEKDLTAYNCLYDCYAPALYGLILKLTSDKGIAATILEKCFLKFWLQIEGYDSTKDKLFMWMVRITIKQCYDVLGLPKRVILDKLQLKKPY